MNKIPLIDIPQRETLALVFADATREHPLAAYRVTWFCKTGQRWKAHGHFLGALTEHTPGKRPRKGFLLPVKVGGASRLYHLAGKATTALSRMVKDRELSEFPQNHMVYLRMPIDRTSEQIDQLKTYAQAAYRAPLFTDELPPRGVELCAVGAPFDLHA